MSEGIEETFPIAELASRLGQNSEQKLRKLWDANYVEVSACSEPGAGSGKLDRSCARWSWFDLKEGTIIMAKGAPAPQLGETDLSDTAFRQLPGVDFGRVYVPFRTYYDACVSVPAPL